MEKRLSQEAVWEAALDGYGLLSGPSVGKLAPPAVAAVQMAAKAATLPCPAALSGLVRGSNLPSEYCVSTVLKCMHIHTKHVCNAIGQTEHPIHKMP